MFDNQIITDDRSETVHNNIWINHIEIYSNLYIM